MECKTSGLEQSRFLTVNYLRVIENEYILFIVEDGLEKLF